MARKNNPTALDFEGNSDIDELQDAFDARTLPEARLKEHGRLPFLLRNLRRGFVKACKRHNVSTVPSQPPEGPVKVVYKYYLEAPSSGQSEESTDAGSDDGREHQTFVGCMKEWLCPVCQLHRPFTTRDVLVFHLKRDHKEFKMHWKEFYMRNKVNPSIYPHVCRY